MIGRRGRVMAGAVVAGWLAVAGSPEAIAQQAGKPGAASAADPQLERARQLYKDGVKEANRGDWQKARALFTEALNLRPHFQIAFSLAEAELKLGDHLAAAEHLAFFLRQAKEIGEEERRRVEGMLDEAKRNVATLVLSTNQPGAEVRVDGISKGNAPLGREVFVAPGRHVLQAYLEGFVPAMEVRTSAAGAQLELELTLSKAATAAPTAPRAATATKPMPAPEAPAQGGPSMGVLITGTVVGAVGVVTGAGLLVASQLTPSTTGEKLTSASFGSLAAGGVIGMATLIYALAAPTRKASAAPVKASAKVTVAPVAGPGGAGVWATVRW